MNKLQAHESARQHVTGQARYIDDMPGHGPVLYGAVVFSKMAHAKIASIKIEKALKTPGIKAILLAKDIPGNNQMGPVIKDEPCLAENEVQFIGQAVCLIAAENKAAARKAESLIKINYKPLKSILTMEEAIRQNNAFGPERKIARGNPDMILKTCEFTLEGSLRTGAQEHWYLETQSALCEPGEDNEMHVFSSTQHPSEGQAIIADVLGLERNRVTVEVRRMGGAFGGKETQANHTAVWCALLSRATGRPVRITLPRRTDQIITGKRHPFLINYEVGFNKEGIIQALKIDLNSDGGAAVDLSYAILERAMFHAENAYYIPDIKITGKVWKTNHPPNTAFRGFGGPQGMAGMENIIDRIARFLKTDAAIIRHRNFYNDGEHSITPYQQKIERNQLLNIYDRLVLASEYYKRREAVNRFNGRNKYKKKGLALTPVKFGISFTTSYLNQAGALVHFYTDGSVMINHGGTEMGQGLHTKIRDIAANELGLPPEQIKITATNTSKVPNTSATAASSGTDLNGMAVKNAIDKLKKRVAPVIARKFGEQHSSESHPGHLRYANGYIYDSLHPNRMIKFNEAVGLCYLQRVSLSATGYYATPDIWFDREKGIGRPFYYYAFGMAVSEVEVDILTGAHTILRTDIIHDVGESINPAIDRGQIEGGFIQGAGWCTTEECKWDEKGRLLSDSPGTYKIPTAADIPADFRVQFLEGSTNPHVISNSKAVGEPPFMLSLSVWLAIKDAISAVANHRAEPELSLPATNEVILQAVESVKTR
ncbi:MAG: xanthine dehydrogenase molybdopterin binding subunit [Calditrichaceae bacterium]|nr:xanthine dehydrogenase molybdopterin binding subunit [Calditrichaceae bacterium]MBN2710418.1 xanthine dehydrogenase molybdopterin binding subunit [Calditrichaceae bacterium]RQV94586.1 MAG: xanthine dehydrogenase molybdopterin binding subunit [Calditrichota bacterium]